MSIIGEHRSHMTALKLEEILLDVVEGWGDHKSAVMGFSKKHLYDWYLEECADSFSHEPNERIVKAFKEKYDL